MGSPGQLQAAQRPMTASLWVVSTARRTRPPRPCGEVLEEPVGEFGRGAALLADQVAVPGGASCLRAQLGLSLMCLTIALAATRCQCAIAP
jgi:hypothetical protein